MQEVEKVEKEEGRPDVPQMHALWRDDNGLKKEQVLMCGCGWYTEWICGDCDGDPECPNYIKEEVEVKQDKQLKLFDL